MIVSSFSKEYGIRLSHELKRMKWREFSSLVSGLGPDTALGRVVAIRAETDPEVIKNFSDSQREIYHAWRTKKAKDVPEKKMEEALEQFRTMFINLSGGGNYREE